MSRAAAAALALSIWGPVASAQDAEPTSSLTWVVERAEEFDAQADYVPARWQTRSRRRLVLARHALEAVYELGSVRHSVVAAARIGQMYAHLSRTYAELAIPRREILLALVRAGEDRPGYDEARAHFEACLAWVSHHAVAPDWTARCERGLHELDPHVYPLQAELHGDATYDPVSTALPPGVDE